MIGEVLTYLPPDSDGRWPTEPVRGLIEDSASLQLETAMHTGKFHSWGVVTWSLTGGGILEDEFATRLRS